jgi:hypothetical protein
MQDELFLDLLWSDPHEGRGLVASERGDGIVKFGSDTVRDFLRRSGCELLVRSHECPPGAKNATFCASYTFKRSFYQDRLGTNIEKALKTEWRFFILGEPGHAPGYVKHHGGKTYTIFSASNYCGYRGNRGAVMIFDDRMRFDIEEHMAPSLEEQAAMYARESSSSPTGSDRTRIGRGGGGAALSRQASASELSRQQSDGMDAVIIQRLQQVRK